MQILLIDPDPTYLDIMSLELSLDGHEIIKTSDLKDALICLHSGSRPHLILADQDSFQEDAGEFSRFLENENLTCPLALFGHPVRITPFLPYRYYLGSFNKLEFSRVVEDLLGRISPAVSHG